MAWDGMGMGEKNQHFLFNSFDKMCGALEKTKKFV